MAVTPGLVFAVVLCFVFPVLARAAERSGRLPTWLSSIVTCYGVGILARNLGLISLGPDAGSVLEGVAGAAMLFGLPLLLFTVRIRESVQTAGSMLLGFGLCAASGLFCTFLTARYFAGDLPAAEKVAGMLVGLYTGGTPNAQSIALALDAPTDYIVLVQGADVVLGGAYLLGLVSFLPKIYGFVFRADERTPTSGNDTLLTARVPAIVQIKQFCLALGVAVLSVATTLALTWGRLDMTLLMLSLTTLSLVVAMWGGILFGSDVKSTDHLMDEKHSGMWARTRVQRELNPANRGVQWLDQSYPLGEYFVLIFCVALGLLVDFTELAEKGGSVLRFSAIALGSTTVLHLLLCRAFNLTRDTAILSSVAGFYGPVFVAQIATSLQNRRLMAAGIAVSLLGFGLGNYLGIGMAWLLGLF